MSEENLELVGRIYRAMDEKDVAAIADLADPTAEWIPDERIGEGPIQGRDQVMEFFAERAEMFGEIATQIERIWDVGDNVLAFIQVSGSGVSSGARFEIRIAHLWTFRDGLVVRGQAFGDRAAALNATGVTE